MNADLKKWLPWIAVGVMALILGVVVFANRGDGGTVAASTTTAEQQTSSTAAATTTTSVPESTTTSTPETTTTSSPEDTTTTSAAVTTTTAAGSTVELSDEGVQAGAEWVHFGYDDEDAIVAVAAVLGAPTHDSGWVDSFSVYGTCPSPVVRGVHWNDFVMLFTQSDTDFWVGGVPHFFAYYFTNPDPDLVTTESIGIDSSVEELENAYGGPLYTMEESFFDPAVGYWTYDLQTWTGLWGYSTGQSPAHVVTSINGGSGCGE
ncbi:MAG: hypothetical protein M3112_02865 [Actinomycetia bacterium]|nr:hypothetical protein [Actinomycetes bacterium]